jgi:hypothetical protein
MVGMMERVDKTLRKKRNGKRRNSHSFKFPKIDSKLAE